MSIRRRIKFVERLVPEAKRVSDKELERVSEWLVQNSEEFRECIRQLFRLKCQIDGFDENWETLNPPFREKAEGYMNRMEQLIEQYRECVSL